MRRLIAAEADVNMQNDDGRTPLHSCIRGGGFVKDLMLELLLEANCDVTTIKDRNGDTPLEKALKEAERTYYRLLIRHLTRQWSPERHKYFSEATKTEIFTFLLVNKRLALVDRQVARMLIVPYIGAHSIMEEPEPRRRSSSSSSFSGSGD